MIANLQARPPSIKLCGHKVFLVGGSSGYAVIHSIVLEGGRRTFAANVHMRSLRSVAAIRTHAALDALDRLPVTKLEFLAVHSVGCALVRPNTNPLHSWATAYLPHDRSNGYSHPEWPPLAFARVDLPAQAREEWLSHGTSLRRAA